MISTSQDPRSVLVSALHHVKRDVAFRSNDDIQSAIIWLTSENDPSRKLLYLRQNTDGKQADLYNALARKVLVSLFDFSGKQLRETVDPCDALVFEYDLLRFFGVAVDHTDPLQSSHNYMCELCPQIATHIRSYRDLSMDRVHYTPLCDHHSAPYIEYGEVIYG